MSSDQVFFCSLQMFLSIAIKENFKSFHSFLILEFMGQVLLQIFRLVPLSHHHFFFFAKDNPPKCLLEFKTPVFDSCSWIDTVGDVLQGQ